MDAASRTTTMSKAVKAAQSIIKSRTGATIIRQSYNRRKNDGGGRIQENFNLKELRKLQQNKRQYSQKLEAGNNPEQCLVASPVESPSKTDVGEGNWASPRTQRNVKIYARAKRESTSSPPPNAALLNERREELEVATNIIVRLPTPFENSDPELGGEDKEINKDIIEEQEQPGKLLNNTVTLKSQIRMYYENSKVSTWLASIEETERDPAAIISSTSSRKNRDSEAESKTNIREESSPFAIPSVYHEKTDKPPKSATLTLPKISCSNSSGSPRVSRSRKLRRTDSVNDPRFTRLLHTLTPVNGTLKLPQIVRKEEERKD